MNERKGDTVIIAKLDRLTRSVKDLCGLLELFEKGNVALISVAESLDTGSAAGRLVITILAAVSESIRRSSKPVSRSRCGRRRNTSPARACLDRKDPRIG